MGVAVPSSPSPSPSAAADQQRRNGGVGVGGYREKDAESLFRTKPISEIRNVESSTRKQIQDKSEELRQLVGNRYRDLIDSADSIVLMKSSCESISANISAIHDGILLSLSSESTPKLLAATSPNPARARIYGIASRVKYLVDTPENIWGCLDEFMFLEAAARYTRAKQVHHCLIDINNDNTILSNFPLLQHQWQIVESFKLQISQRSRERLLDHALGLSIVAYADALAAVAIVDELQPKQVLSLFLDSRKSCISQKLLNCSTANTSTSSDVISAFCQVLKIIQVSLGQIGELFLQVLSDMPLFYKVILGSPPASQLFGSIPNPDEEVRLWKLFRDKLESVMVTLERDFIAKTCSDWLKSCGKEIVNKINGRIRELVMEDDADLWDEIFEDAFVQRMKAIIDLGYEDLTRNVNVTESIHAIAEAPGHRVDFQAYLNRSYLGGGVWFMEQNISQIRDAVDSCCESVLEDLLRFLESPKASLRLKVLAPYLQNKCYQSISVILMELKNELEHLSAALEKGNSEGQSVPSPATIVERSLFIGRVLFSFQKHSRHIPVILGSPRFWVSETTDAVSGRSASLLRHSSITIDSPMSDSPGKKRFDFSKRKTSLPTSALFGVDDNSSPQLEELTDMIQDLSNRAYNLWISWVSDELSAILSRDLRQDDGLSTTSPLRGWEDTVVKQEQSDESQSEMKISLPAIPSLYITSFLFRACEEIHRVGGHVLDKPILQKFALRLLEKVIGIYADFLSTAEARDSQMSDKGVLQVLLDFRFVADVLSGGDSNTIEELSKNVKSKFSLRRKQDVNQTKSVIRERVDSLVNRLSQRLDPIDWLTYEPYLWENERQSYLRHAVLYGFFVQLNRMYTDTVQKLPTNSESNIMRCSTVPRFKYLPISAPALSSRGTTTASISTSRDDVSSRSSWKSYTNEELSRNIDIDDDSSFGVAAPFLKSFMQGTRVSESGHAMDPARRVIERGKTRTNLVGDDPEPFDFDRRSRAPFYFDDPAPSPSQSSLSVSPLPSQSSLSLSPSLSPSLLILIAIEIAIVSLSLASDRDRLLASVSLSLGSLPNCRVPCPCPCPCFIAERLISSLRVFLILGEVTSLDEVVWLRRRVRREVDLLFKSFPHLRRGHLLGQGSNFAPPTTNGGQVGAGKHQQLHGDVGNGQNHQDPPPILPEVAQNEDRAMVQRCLEEFPGAMNGVPAAVEVQGRPTEISLQNGALSMPNFVPPIVNSTNVLSGSPLALTTVFQAQPDIPIACNGMYGTQFNAPSPNVISIDANGQYHHIPTLMVNSQHPNSQVAPGLVFGSTSQVSGIPPSSSLPQQFLTLADVQAMFDLERGKRTLPFLPDLDVKPPYPIEMLSYPYSEGDWGIRGSNHVLRLREFSKSLTDRAYSCVEEVKALVREWVVDGELKLPHIEGLLPKKDRKGPNYCVFHRSLGHPTEKCRTLKKIFIKKVEADELEFKEQGPQDILEDVAMMAYDGHNPSSRSVHPLRLPRDNLASARTSEGQPYFRLNFRETIFTFVDASLVDSITFRGIFLAEVGCVLLFGLCKLGRPGCLPKGSFLPSRVYATFGLLRDSFASVQTSEGQLSLVRVLKGNKSQISLAKKNKKKKPQREQCTQEPTVFRTEQISGSSCSDQRQSHHGAVPKMRSLDLALVAADSKAKNRTSLRRSRDLLELRLERVQIHEPTDPKRLTSNGFECNLEVAPLMSPRTLVGSELFWDLCTRTMGMTESEQRTRSRGRTSSGTTPNTLG
ncbi:hypothetical protein HYC85_022445 [Camellia sinensis]|uniref:Conserved oligomeric Golgi complex subunit 1 n=1 Tax=Camellia sinensis TaxID=4442 RepID=A0A7J7GPG3_CAMSI|nr:hypothetical protein HYC85_022445 [Camellia sinensis]